MFCKACSTRLSPSDKQCPNCGRTVRPGSSMSGGTTGAKSPDPPPLAPSPLARKDEADEDAVELSDEANSQRPASRRSSSRSRSKASRGAGSSSSGSPLALRPEELRARITEHPEMVEDGLQVYRHPQSGKVLGVGLETDVGDIDLLGVDESGGLVVVMVADRDQSDPVAAVLERLGWVSKHLAEGGQEVRGVVLFEPPPPELGYAARAVADAVAFKTWRVTVALDDVEL